MGGILALNGQNVVIDPEGQKWLVRETEQVRMDIAQWHDYTILAQGNHLIHKIDGKVAAELTDFGTKTQLLEGILAFQLHQSPAMVLQVKEVLLKELPEGGVMAFDAAKLPANAKRLEDPKNKGQAKPDPGQAAASTRTPRQWKWVWSDSPEANNAARLKTEFDLDGADIKEAVRRVSCDNGAQVFLNGELVVTNSDWFQPTRANVTKMLRRGKNELQAEATNKGGAAGFLAVLTLKLADGSERTVYTDASWWAAPPAKEDWKPAKIVSSSGSCACGSCL